MKNYKFRLSESNFIKFTQKELDGFQDVTFQDENNKKGKIIPVNRSFDHQVYDLIVPLELIEECEDE